MSGIITPVLKGKQSCLGTLEAKSPVPGPLTRVEADEISLHSTKVNTRTSTHKEFKQCCSSIITPHNEVNL